MQSSSSADAVAPRKKPGWRRVLLFVVSLVVLWGVLFKGCAMACDAPLPPMRPAWTAGEGMPAPSGFGFLGFPASSTVKLFDAPDGTETGTLGRAVGIGRDEERGEWVRLAGNPAGFVRRSDLGLEPPDGWRALLESYNAARAKNEGLNFVRAGITTERLPDGRLRVVFDEYLDDWRQVSTYVVKDGRGHAETFATQGKEAAFEGAFDALARAAWAVPVTLVLGVLGTWLLRRTILRRGRTKRSVVPATTT